MNQLRLKESGYSEFTQLLLNPGSLQAMFFFQRLHKVVLLRFLIILTFCTLYVHCTLYVVHGPAR